MENEKNYHQDTIWTYFSRSSWCHFVIFTAEQPLHCKRSIDSDDHCRLEVTTALTQGPDILGIEMQVDYHHLVAGFHKVEHAQLSAGLLIGQMAFKVLVLCLVP